MKRVLAVAAALGMIGVSLFVRGRLDDNGTTSPSSSSTTSKSDTIVCVTDLRAACDALARDGMQVEVEAAAVTAAKLIDEAGSVNIGAWLAPSAWSSFVASERERLGRPAVLEAPSPIIARSPVVIAIWKDRLAALQASACPKGVDWKCLGAAAGRQWSDVGGQASWGRVKLGLPDPSAGGGLVVLGGIADGYFGHHNYAANDFDVDPEFRPFLTKVGADSNGTLDPVGEMLTRGPGLFGAAGALEAFAAPTVASSSRAAEVQVLYPAPVATADLVLVPVSGKRGLLPVRKNGAMLDALAGGGWRVDGRPLGSGLSTTLELPPTAGLPLPGVLGALRSLWMEVAK